VIESSGHSDQRKNDSLTQCLNDSMSSMVFGQSCTMLGLLSFLNGPVEFMALTLTSSPLSQLALVVIFVSKGWGPYLRQHFLDKTFQGLYQINAFDLA